MRDRITNWAKPWNDRGDEKLKRLMKILVLSRVFTVVGDDSVRIVYGSMTAKASSPILECRLFAHDVYFDKVKVDHFYL